MSTSRAPSKTADKFIMRMPAGLRDRLGATARARSRSMNSIMVEALEAAFPDVGSVEGFAADLRQLETAFLANSENGIRDELRQGVRALLAGR